VFAQLEYFILSREHRGERLGCEGSDGSAWWLTDPTSPHTAARISSLVSRQTIVE
jgi:hypothetical protein